MHRHQQRRLKIRTAIFVIIGALLAFGATNRVGLTQDTPSSMVYLPYVTGGNGAPPTEVEAVEFDLSSPSEEQLEALNHAVEHAGLRVKREPGKLTILHEEDGEQRTVMTLNCLDKKCKNLTASNLSAEDGLKITIRVNGTLSAIVEQVSRRLVIVSFIVDGAVIENIEFKCRNCDIDINIPADMAEPAETPTEEVAAEPTHTPTPTDVPVEEPTHTPTPTEQPVEEPTHTPTPTEQPVEEPTTTPTDVPPVSAERQYWHPPGSHDGLNVHEHGDAPPAWANEFSMASFGHPVMFGGDESTPHENELKHQAYKGFIMDADDASGVDLYIRYHGMSNPFGRSGPLHSYEVYALDSSGNVSIWQGQNFYGYPEFREQRMTRRHEVAGVDGFPGRDQFIIAAPDEVDWDNYLRCEQWYGHGGLWAWDVSITICNSTTYFTYDEHLGDVTDMSTWRPTGDLGDTRRLEVSHYGPQNPNVGGLNLPFDQWFCAKLRPDENRSEGAIPSWSITGAVSGPDACADGWVPQYVADTFPKAGVYFQTGNTAETTFPVDGVTLPN